MELSRQLLIGLLEALNNNFVSWSVGPHGGHLFLLLLCCTCTCSCYAFVVRTPILATPLFYICFCYTFVVLTSIFATPLFCICSCYTFVVHTPILVTTMLHTCSCYSFIVHAIVLVVPQLCMYLFNLCFYSFLELLGLLFNFWLSYIFTLNYSLAFDPLALPPCATP